MGWNWAEELQAQVEQHGFENIVFFLVDANGDALELTVADIKHKDGIIQVDLTE